MSTFYRKLGLPITDLWIETGTSDGGSIMAALAIGYKEIRSVECHLPTFLRVSKQFGPVKNVFIYQGESPDVLPKIIDPKKTTTFWLDAHYTGTDTDLQDRKYGQCPLMAELDVICSFQWRQLPIIVIDDWPNFHGGVGPEYVQSEWPLWGDVEKKLDEYKIDIESNIAWCVPKQ